MTPSLATSMLLLASFALFLTSHAALAYGLIRRLKPWWHSLVVLLPPAMWLAPYWGLKLKLRVRSGLWLFSLCAYIAALIAAYSG